MPALDKPQLRNLVADLEIEDQGSRNFMLLKTYSSGSLIFNFFRLAGSFLSTNFDYFYYDCCLKHCGNSLWIPDASGPNSDGKMIISKQVILEQLNLSVYLYKTDGENWFSKPLIRKQGGMENTMVNSTTQIFVWSCEYKLLNQPLQMQKGAVVFIS